MAISNKFGDYNPNEYDFVPFLSLQKKTEIKVISNGIFNEIYSEINDDYKKRSDVKIVFEDNTIKKGSCTLKFEVLKGNNKANDPDGHLCYLAKAKKGYLFSGLDSKRVELGIKKYGDVIPITFTKSSMETIDSISFYFKDNSEDWLDLKGDLKDDWLNCGNLKISENCICNDWATIKPVIPTSAHINWNSAYLDDPGRCYRLSVLQLKNMKYAPTGKQYQVAKEVNGNQIFYPNELKKAIEYIKKALKMKIPVLCGVDDSPGTPNRDTITDHFVVIVGMGIDTIGSYLLFYDNASAYEEIVTSADNKLYCYCEEGKIEGEGDKRNGYIQGTPHGKYTLSRVIESQ